MRQHKALFGCSNILHLSAPPSLCAPDHLPLPSSHRSASGWSTLAPDDSEVVANMQAYLRSLLQQSPSSQSQLQQELPTTTSTDSQGWSIPQRTLVCAGFVSLFGQARQAPGICCYKDTCFWLVQVWVARQLARIPVVRGVTDIMSSLYVKLVSGRTDGRTDGRVDAWVRVWCSLVAGGEQCCWRRTAPAR